MTASKVTKMSDKNRILIVDDDEVVRRSYLRSLQSMSCNVEAASDGEQALQTMEQNPCDVVLLDLRMPGQDGLSVLRTIKQKWSKSEVVIITEIIDVLRTKTIYDFTLYKEGTLQRRIERRMAMVGIETDDMDRYLG